MSEMILNRTNTEYHGTTADRALTPNAFPFWAYEKAGIQCKGHLFKKTEFLYNGKSYNRKEANALMAKMGWTIEYVPVAEEGLTLHTTRVYHNWKPVTR